jgi:hypothetical protein
MSKFWVSGEMYFFNPNKFCDSLDFQTVSTLAYTFYIVMHVI